MTNELTSQGETSPDTFQSQVDPAALQALFNADPESLNEQDLDVICAELRKQRERFEKDEEAKALKPKAKKATKSITKEESKQLSLDDIGL